jgi:hypothetical protein
LQNVLRNFRVFKQVLLRAIDLTQFVTNHSSHTRLRLLREKRNSQFPVTRRIRS